MRPAPLVLLLALACARPAPSAAALLAAGDHERSLAHGGRQRSYVLHVPPHAGEESLPLLLAFHGGGGNARGFQRYAGLDALADRDGFLVAYPNGTGRLPRVLTWNAGDCCGFAAEARVDDVGFARAVIEDIARSTPLDRTRVYATGHSNGAMLAYRLAAEAADAIAAIAPVAGAPAQDALAGGPPVPVLHIHSVDDPRALYGGGVRETFGREIRHRAVEAQLALWRERDGCPPEPARLETRERPGPDGAVQRAELLVWAPCAAGSEVRLWRLHGVGHGWPGAGPILPERLMGPPTEILSAADEVWSFVRRFRLGSREVARATSPRAARRRRASRRRAPPS